MPQKQPTAEVLIHELCLKLSRDSPSRANRLKSHALLVLSDLGDSPIPNSDENSVLNRIKKDLASKGRQGDAAKISELHRKLSSTGRIQNLWSLLHFLKCLSKEHGNKYSKGTLSFRQGVLSSSTPVPQNASDNFQSNSSIAPSTLKSTRLSRNTPESFSSDIPSMSLGSRLAWSVTPSYQRSASNVSKPAPVSTVSSQSRSHTADSDILREIIVVFQGVETDLMKEVQHAKDLDEIIVAHRQFLEAIMKRCLLDSGSQSLLTQLRSIFDQIVKFEKLQGDIYEKASQEANHRVAHERSMREKEEKGVWSDGSLEDAEEKQRRKYFRKDQLPKMRAQLSVCAQTFQDMVVKFLSQLDHQTDPNLRYLSQRLDFNDHYKAKDPARKYVRI